MKQNFKQEGIDADKANYVQNLENKILDNAAREQKEQIEMEPKEVIDGQADAADPAN